MSAGCANSQPIQVAHGRALIETGKEACTGVVALIGVDVATLPKALRKRGETGAVYSGQLDPDFTANGMGGLVKGIKLNCCMFEA